MEELVVVVTIVVDGPIEEVALVEELEDVVELVVEVELVEELEDVVELDVEVELVEELEDVVEVEVVLVEELELVVVLVLGNMSSPMTNFPVWP